MPETVARGVDGCMVVTIDGQIRRVASYAYVLYSGRVRLVECYAAMDGGADVFREIAIYGRDSKWPTEYTGRWFTDFNTAEADNAWINWAAVRGDP